MTYQYDLTREGSGAYTQGIAGETLADRDLVYLNASGQWVKADIDAASSMPVIGLALGGLTTGKWGRILLRGFVGHSTWSWTEGGALFPTTVAGVISQTAPTSELRQTVGYAVEDDLIYFDRGAVENVINWSSTLREVTCVVHGAKQLQTLQGGEWWVIDAQPAETMRDNFTGVFDLTGIAGINAIISNYAYYADKTGAGSITANVGANAGMRMTTGATTNDDVTVTTGDNSASAYTWNPANTTWMHLHYRFPNAGDAVAVRFMGMFYQDANNYVGIRYDTAVDTNLRFVTRALGAETLTVLGALDTDWHEIWIKFTATDVRLYQADTPAVLSHTTNIPTGNFTWYNYLKTGADVAKHYDIAHLVLTQGASS